MKLIDCYYLATPFYGACRMAAWLRNHEYRINRKHVRCLMRIIGLKAIYRHPRTSKPAPGHKIYPYLRYSDNLFIEWLWRTVKYEGVYLKAYQDGRDARVGIGDYFHFYNAERHHQALGYRTPAEVFTSMPVETTRGGMLESLIPSTLRTAGPTLNIAPILF